MRKEITISSDVKNFSQVEKFIDEICEEQKISLDMYGSILVSLSECVTNAIVHGNKSKGNKAVEITAHTENSGKELIFVVKDQGKGFDYAILPDPTALENAERQSGRGVYLMNALADLVVFSDNGATVELKFKI